MNQGMKLFVISIVTVIVLVIVGSFIYVGILFSQAKRYNESIESNNMIIEKEVQYIKDININFNVSNVRLTKSNDNNIHVKLFSDNPDNYKVNQENNSLNILLETKEKKSLFKNDLLSLIVVSIPNNLESNISIKGNVGYIYLEEFPKSYVNLDLDVSDIIVRDINEIDAKVNVGDINLYKVNKALNLDLDTGDVIIDKITLDNNSYIKVKLGDVTIDQNKDFKIDAKTEIGSVNVAGSNNDSDITLFIEVDAGDIDVLNIKSSYEKISDIDLYQRIKLEEVDNVEITKYTDAGKETKIYTSNEDIFYYYNMIGNTKLGDRIETSCEDNITVYTFNEKDSGNIQFEFQCDAYIYNDYKLKVIE